MTNRTLGVGPVVAGSAFLARVPLVRGPRDEPIPGLDGTETLTVEIASGPGLPRAWDAAVQWAAPFDPLIPAVDLSYAAGETDGISPGRYPVYLRIGGDLIVFLGWVEIIAGPSAAFPGTAPLITVDEAKAILGDWPDSVTDRSILRCLSLATADLYEAISRAYANDNASLVVDHDDASYRQMQLALSDPGRLEITQPMREFVACMALWYLLRFLPSRGEAKEYRKIGETARLAAYDARRAVVARVAGFRRPIRLGAPSRLVRG